MSEKLCHKIMSKKPVKKEKEKTAKKTQVKEQKLIVQQTALEKELTKDLADLTKQIRRLKDLEFVQVLKKPRRMLWLSFLKGVAVGFGSVIGASLVVGVFIFVLSKLSLVPVIGDAVTSVLQEIDVNEVLIDTNTAQ